MLFPKKVKYRRWQTMRKKNEKITPDTRGLTVAFGSFGLKALEPARVTSNQLEAGRKACKRHVGKLGKVYIRIFPDRPVTRKAAEVGMGKGKGSLDHYCFQVRPGRILYEVAGVSEEVAKEGLRKAGTKMSIKTKIVDRKI